MVEKPPRTIENSEELAMRVQSDVEQHLGSHEKRTQVVKNELLLYTCLVSVTLPDVSEMKLPLKVDRISTIQHVCNNVNGLKFKNASGKTPSEVDGLSFIYLYVRLADSADVASRTPISTIGVKNIGSASCTNFTQRSVA